MDDALLGAELEDIEATAVMEQPEDSAEEVEPEGEAPSLSSILVITTDAQ